MGRRKYYQIRYLTSGIAYQGTSEECANWLGLRKDNFFTHARKKQLVKNKYYVVEVPIETLYEIEYESVKRHLQLYGNTNLVIEKERIVKELEKEGYKLEITKYKKRKKRGGNGKLEDIGSDWIIKWIK